MKKILLLMLTTIVSTTAFAQTSETTKDGNISITLPEVGEMDLNSSENGVANQRRTRSTGLYYDVPEGMMYRRQFTSTGNFSSRSQYFFPYFHEYTYVNESNSPTRTYWNLKEKLATEEGTNLESDSKGNCTMPALKPGETSTALYLYNQSGSENFNMGSYDTYYGLPNTVLHTIYGSGNDDGLYWMGWSDNKTATYCWSSLNTYYILGTGTRTDYTFSVWDAGHYGDDNYFHRNISGSFPVSYITQIFPAPASPLYVDGIYVNGMTFAYDEPEGTVYDKSFQPLKNGAVLTMYIVDEESGDLMETLTATTGDWTAWTTETSEYNYRDYMIGYLKFSKKGEDGEEEPIVIDRKIHMVIHGFYNDDIDIGLKVETMLDSDITKFGGASNGPEEHFIDPSGQYIINSVTRPARGILAVNFNGIMDAVDVDKEYANVTITAEGDECCNTNDSDLGGFVIQTALPWYASDGTANYSLADAPDWIRGITAKAYGEDTNSYVVTLTAAPNKSDERTAVVHIQCKGYADGADITITQLEGDETTGISEIEATTPKMSMTYNLAGQQVDEATKGVVIKDGKKVLNK